MTELPGIGKTIEEKIVALLETGSIPSADKLEGEVPAEPRRGHADPGTRRQDRSHGFTTSWGSRPSTICAPRSAEQRIRALKGLGPKAEENIAAQLEKLGDEGPSERVLLSDALPIAERLAEVLREHPASQAVDIAGSARRMAETCKDIDLIATASDPVALATALVEHPLAAASGNPSSNGARITTYNGVAVDLRIVTPKEYGNLLQHFTGSAAHNVQLRERAVKMGLSVSEHGIKDTETGKVSRHTTEAAVYKRLGLSYIEPELREGRGEIRAAADGKLPKLIELDDIRGDLHSHTTLSDGKNTLEEMAEAREGQGLRLLRGHRPLGHARLRRRRDPGAAGGEDRGDRRAERADRFEPLSRAGRDRESTSSPTARWTTRIRCWSGSTGSSPASTRRSG